MKIPLYISTFLSEDQKNPKRKAIILLVIGCSELEAINIPMTKGKW